MTMKLRTLLWGGAVSCALAVFAVPAVAGVARECEVGKPAAQMSGADYRTEANCIFRHVEGDADLVQDHVSTLQSFVLDPNMSWQSHAGELEDLKYALNDMQSKIGQLEGICSEVAPWQRNAIDEIAKDGLLLVDNAQDAILWINAGHKLLEVPPYRDYIHNLFTEAQKAKKTASEAVRFANVSHEYRTLGHELGARPVS